MLWGVEVSLSSCHPFSAVDLHSLRYLCLFWLVILCVRSVPASLTYAPPKAKTLGMMQSQRRPPCKGERISNFYCPMDRIWLKTLQVMQYNAMVTWKQTIFIPGREWDGSCPQAQEGARLIFHFNCDRYLLSVHGIWDAQIFCHRSVSVRQ